MGRNAVELATPKLSIAIPILIKTYEGEVNKVFVAATRSFMEVYSILVTERSSYIREKIV